MKFSDNKKEFPDWDLYYKQNNVESMPWYEKNLDLDMLEEVQFLEKGEFLDLGTGPGTQAVEISKKGFKELGLIYRRLLLKRPNHLQTM